MVGRDACGEKMTQNQQFAILLPLVVGAGAVVCTILVHALALAATVNFLRHERKLGHAGAGALIDLAIVALVISFAFLAHLIEIAFGQCCSCSVENFRSSEPPTTTQREAPVAMTATRFEACRAPRIHRMKAGREHRGGSEPPCRLWVKGGDPGVAPNRQLNLSELTGARCFNRFLSAKDL